MVWQAVNEHRWPEVPPILHFSKDEGGTVKFNGLCVLQDLRDAWFEDDGRRVQNYHATLDILPVELLDVAWLRSRAGGGPEVHGPRPWEIYSRSGEHQRLVTWAKMVRSETATYDGAPGKNRTCDLRFRKPLLYPLSYEGGPLRE